MIQVQIYIPTFGNDKVVFSDLHHAQFQAVLLNHFGGYSCLPGTVKGQWQDATGTYTDALVVYVVALRSITLGDQVGKVVEFAKAHYAQEAIFITYLGISEIL